MDSLIRLLVIAGVRLLAPALLPFEYALRRLTRSLRGNGWLYVEGKIHAVHTNFNESVWVAEFSYYYSLEGEYYSGFDRKQFARERTADEYAGMFKSGTPVTVRVKPGDHQVSFLEDLYSEQSINNMLRTN